MGNEISPLENRPWLPRPIPTWVMRELNRRRKDHGISYVNNTKAKWEETGDWIHYKGPMAPWVRLCSNGNGKSAFLKPFKNGKDEYDGLIMYGGQGASDTFGLNNNKTILGYEVNGNPHIIPMDGVGLNYTISTETKNNASVPIHLPSPGIIGIDVIQDRRLRQVATIKWRCYGFAQIEYLTPYLLTPHISVILEFGWNHFNPKSLLNLSKNETSTFKVLDKNDKEVLYMYKTGDDEYAPETPNMGLRELFQDGTPLFASNARISNGMYDVVYGIITSFEYSSTDGLTWDCITTVSSKHRAYDGLLPKTKYVVTKTNEEGELEKKQIMNFHDFTRLYLKGVKDSVKKGVPFFEYIDAPQVTPEMKEKFYGGKPEDRAFFSRDSDSWVEEKQPKDNDWDFNDTDSVWVTMGFLLEIFNYFLTLPDNIKDSSNNSIKYYQFDPNGKTMIGGHPNLISIDGKILLIPNAKAPKYNNGTEYKKNQSGSISANKDGYDDQVFKKDPFLYAESFKTLSDIKNNKDDLYYYANNAIWSTFKTGKSSGGGNGEPGVARDDLCSIINSNRLYSDGFEMTEHSFPRYIKDDEIDVKEGYYGYIEDLYVNVDYITSIVKESNTSEEIYNKLLNGLNKASAGFWDLQILQGRKYLHIVDAKHISKLKSPIYQFDVQSSRNIIKTINFNATLSNLAANQAIAKTANNQLSTTDSIDFLFQDRLFDKRNANNQTGVIENNSVIKQLQTNSKNSSQMTMTFMNGAQKNKVNLVLPNEGLLTSILSDNDNKNNTNVYGGQQPGFTLDMTLQGIAGLATLQYFSIKNFPRPYSDKEVIFQIQEVNQIMTVDNWETRIKAGLRVIETIGEQRFTDGSEFN